MLLFFCYQISSWQVPNEVTDLRKKQGNEIFREHSLSVPNVDPVTEKGSASTSLSTPAINTGGRDAIAIRTSGPPGSSSALDLIKKKLQDPGAPATSLPAPVSSVAASEVNGSKVVELAKGLQSENSKDKLKDTTGDGNMSDSSSDSEDADSGPTKEECIIQFKVCCFCFVWKSSVAFIPLVCLEFG